MKKRLWKIGIAAVIFVLVSLMAKISNQNWITVFYSTLLALYAPEIKEFFNKSSKKERIRLSYSYLFRIQIDGQYLLVKDAQGRNQYQPVGGVYKYDSQKVDLETRFDGIYDNMFNNDGRLTDDLRITISKSKLKDFDSWFGSHENRENILDLSREFKEELIDSEILNKNLFKNIKYKYVGSLRQPSFNEKLNMPQIRHFDIVTLRPTDIQKNHLKKLVSMPSDKYIFASKRDIENGSIRYLGKQYTIAEHSKLILVEEAQNLTKELETIIYPAEIHTDNVDSEKYQLV